jgi:hypothetical protein
MVRERQRVRLYLNVFRHLARVITLVRHAQDEAFYSLGGLLVVVRIRRGAGLSLDLIGRIAHCNADAQSLEHQDVVWLVAEGGDLLDRHVEMTREALYHRQPAASSVR